MENDLVRKARNFAIAAHGKQNYAGSKPYKFHLDHVHEIAVKFKLTIDIRAAAYLHDTIEDAGKKYAEINDNFGHVIAEMVYCVTDELGRSRKETLKKNLPKLQGNTLATILKLCDRIANLQYSITGQSLYYLRKYTRESWFIEHAVINNINPGNLPLRKLFSCYAELILKAENLIDSNKQNILTIKLK